MNIFSCTKQTTVSSQMQLPPLRPVTSHVEVSTMSSGSIIKPDSFRSVLLIKPQLQAGSLLMDFLAPVTARTALSPKHNL